MKHSFYLDRLRSFFYDILFAATSFYLVKIGIEFLDNPFLNILIIPVFILIYILEFSWLPLKLKGTLGHYLNDLMVEPTNGRVTFGRNLFREIILKHILYLSLIGIITDIVFLVIKKETLHNYLLKTKIIKRQENDEVNDKKRRKQKFLIKNK